MHKHFTSSIVHTIRARLGLDKSYAIISIPSEARSIIDSLKQRPGDSLETVLREALLTHQVVLREIRRGGRIYDNRDAQLSRLPLAHLDSDLPPSTPPKNLPPLRVIDGSKR